MDYSSEILENVNSRIVFFNLTSKVQRVRVPFDVASL